MPIPDLAIYGIGRFPVTNAQYRRFVQDTGYREPKGTRLFWAEEGYVDREEDFEPWKDPGFSDDTKPMVCVSYDDALEYCKWVNEKTGDTLLWQTSLPTGAIWNVAAFGSYRTPGGDWLNAQTVIHKGAASPASVFAENRSNCRGVSDLLGNVWEWCLEPRAQGGGLQQASSFLDHEIYSYNRKGYVDHSLDWQIKGGGYLDGVGFDIAPFEWVNQIGRDARHSDLGFRISARIAASPELDDANREEGWPEVWVALPDWVYKQLDNVRETFRLQP